MSTKTIDLNTYLHDYKTELEQLDSVNQVKILGSSFTADDIDKLSHQYGVANVLITAVGGPVRLAGQQRLNTCTFGIYVLAGKDNDNETIGYSSFAIDTTKQILDLVHKNEVGKKHPASLRVPVITEFSALSNQDFEKRGFVVWYLIFNQELIIA